jgi:very-short-patch-repair endonuclease
MKRETIKQVARQLRKDETKSEELFWNVVRNRKLNNRKFYRQHPIKYEYLEVERYFIADFYCPEKKLVVEIDGKIHENQKEYDETRTQIINCLGIQVIRFQNEDLNKIDELTSKLTTYLL